MGGFCSTARPLNQAPPPIVSAVEVHLGQEELEQFMHTEGKYRVLRELIAKSTTDGDTTSIRQFNKTAQELEKDEFSSPASVMDVGATAVKWRKEAKKSMKQELLHLEQELDTLPVGSSLMQAYQFRILQHEHRFIYRLVTLCGLRDIFSPAGKQLNAALQVTANALTLPKLFLWPGEFIKGVADSIQQAAVTHAQLPILGASYKLIKKAIEPVRDAQRRAHLLYEKLRERKKQAPPT